ncbi:MAG: proline--tRNA ligase [Pseudomonadota bacterium]
MAKRITPRSEDYSKWYVDIVINAKLADYSPVKGCMVIRPNGYEIWENIQKNLDKMFKETGHKNAYFPMLIPESFMHKEAEHVEGFSPECAVVTHGGGKKLDEPLFIRPTSETIIWSMYKKWIMSYRDLPLLYNQWANVVRWEMRTRLFLRTTEFLWQEGHTAHATAEEAEEETVKMLGVYKKFAEEYMAVPVLTGIKTENEKFAGAKHTYCIEAMMQDKKALQAGTSHNLDQNFAKAFDVKFQDSDGEMKYVYATSWGVSTRLIGALIMAHSDDEGLILPPKLAENKVIIIPISKNDDQKEEIMAYAKAVSEELTKASINHILDDRENYKPGWKFAEAELVGIPLRIDIGPKDMENNSLFFARRDTKEKFTVTKEGFVQVVKDTLDNIQKTLFDRALKLREDHTFNVDTYDDFKEKLENPGGFINAHWCGDGACEKKIAAETKASIRCLTFDYEKEAGKCIRCEKDSKRRVIFAKAY